MIVLALKIFAGVSLLPFIGVFITSMKIRLRIPPTNHIGVPWDQVALYGQNGIMPASRLISVFKRGSTGLICAIGMIAFGFIVPMIQPPEAFKDVNLHYYLTLGVGLLGGWLALFGCIRYGNLVMWNILGIVPKTKNQERKTAHEDSRS